MRFKSSDKKKVDKDDRMLLMRRVKKKIRSMRAKRPKFRRSPDGPIERKESRAFWKRRNTTAQNPIANEVLPRNLIRDSRYDPTRRFLKVRILGRIKFIQSFIKPRKKGERSFRDPAFPLRQSISKKEAPAAYPQSLLVL